MKKSTFVITQNTKGERLDLFVSSQSDLTRSQVQKLIRKGFVTVNLRTEKASYKVKGDDMIEFSQPDDQEEILIPEDMPLDIIWQDEHIIVVNKPPHMVTHPAAGNRTGTLMNALASRCEKLASIGAPLRPGVVHRLDKDTSGVIVIAKDDESYYSLIRQFKQREVEKHYVALLYGNLKKDHGDIKVAIGRSVSDRKKMSTRTRRGKEAVTQFEVMKRSPSVTLVKIKILTGRTHQIRVHFSSIGHPVLGDRTYGGKTLIKVGQKTAPFSRQMLHAYSIKLKHPVSGEVLEFTAPMPEDMEKAIEELEALANFRAIQR